MQDGVASLAGIVAEIAADRVGGGGNSTSRLRRIQCAHILVDVDRNVGPRRPARLRQRSDFSLRGQR